MESNFCHFLKREQSQSYHNPNIYSLNSTQLHVVNKIDFHFHIMSSFLTRPFLTSQFQYALRLRTFGLQCYKWVINQSVSPLPFLSGSSLSGYSKLVIHLTKCVLPRPLFFLGLLNTKHPSGVLGFNLFGIDVIISWHSNYIWMDIISPKSLSNTYMKTSRVHMSLKNGTNVPFPSILLEP